MKVDSAIKTLSVKSSAFANRAMIPPMYTRDGENINPPLSIRDVPEQAESLAILVDDPDAHGKNAFVHWLMWNLPVDGKIAENSAPGTAGKNDFGEFGYDGPAPPSGTHRYFFKVYALDTRLKLPEGADFHEFRRAIEHHIVGYGELVGMYGRAF